jgi:hypothetical protein
MQEILIDGGEFVRQLNVEVLDHLGVALGHPRYSCVPQQISDVRREGQAAVFAPSSRMMRSIVGAQQPHCARPPQQS